MALYLGRLSREKNLVLLLEAWAALHAVRPDARLLLVGDGPLAGALRGPGVVQAGALHGAELATVVASTDLLAFPSETETFGNAVVEAQAAGLPVVVSTRGAAHEHVLPGVTGEVVDCRWPFALTDALLGLLGDPARRARMGAAAHRHAARYDQDVAAQETFALYRRQVGRGFTPRRGTT